MAAKKAAQRASRPPPLTVDISPALKRRIKVAAAAQDMAVSAYIARVLERTVPATEAFATSADGGISAGMIRRAAARRGLAQACRGGELD